MNMALKDTIDEYFNFLRTKSKYEDQENISIDEARDKLWEIVKEHEIEQLF